MEKPEEVVVADSSVIVKWFVEEEDSDHALKLRDDYVSRKVDIAVPELLFYEVINSLRYNPDFGLDELKFSGKILEDYNFWTFPLREELIEGSIGLAARYGITIYDASYLAIGKLRSWVTYTADTRTKERVKDDAALKHIAEYQSR